MFSINLSYLGQREMKEGSEKGGWKKGGREEERGRKEMTYLRALRKLLSRTFTHTQACPYFSNEPRVSMQSLHHIFCQAYQYPWTELVSSTKVFSGIEVSPIPRGRPSDRPLSQWTSCLWLCPRCAMVLKFQGLTLSTESITSNPELKLGSRPICRNRYTSSLEGH